MNKLTTRKLAFTGLFISLVFVFSAVFQIPYTTPFGNTRFHLGNVFCLLAGLILGPVYGGIAAGLGSMFFDFTNPIYFSGAPITFINKFAMGFVAGLYFSKAKGEKLNPKIWISAILGQLTYIILYLLKTYIVNLQVLNLGREAMIFELAQKAGVSTINGIISVIVASILAIPLLKSIKFDE